MFLSRTFPMCDKGKLHVCKMYFVSNINVWGFFKKLTLSDFSIISKEIYSHLRTINSKMSSLLNYIYIFTKTL